MARLIYSGNISLDGYTADAEGKFDWSAPDGQVHAHINDLHRAVRTWLLGRRMYEVLTPWETMHTLPDQPPHILDFAQIWQAADKIVYSSTLREPSTARTRIEREFHPDAIRQLKESAESDLTVGGADLAAQVIRAGLVDELHMFISPVVVGGGKRFLPADLRLNLELMAEHRFDNGVVHLHYGVQTGQGMRAW
ncbi:MAG: dihydrofolate reductase family protein [Micromonosporaceae bacterium]